MDNADVIGWIRDDAAEAASLLSDADPGQPVPSCPGWQADGLVQHLGVGFAGWYCYNIATPAQEWTPEGLFGSFPSAEGLAEGVPSVATGSSADLLAWMQGRPLGQPLTIDGDSALLADWNLMQKRNA